MALTDAQREKLRAAAEERGVDADELIATAEQRLGEASTEGESDSSEAAPNKPAAERLLIGFLPFMTVRELRQNWLGLMEPIKDEELTTGEFERRHGADASPSDSGDDGDTS